METSPSLPSRRVLKILRGDPKGKIQRWQKTLGLEPSGFGGVPRRLEKITSDSEGVGFWSGGLWDPTSVEKENENLYNDMETSLNLGGRLGWIETSLILIH